MAEVLITLGIIGIVAALTIPSLLGKYRQKALETAFKKQYSVLSNAINYSGLANGNTQCYTYFDSASGSYKSNAGDCESLENDLIERMKLTEIKTNVKDSYAKKNDVLAGGGKSTNWVCNYDWYTHMTNTYMSNDGALIMLSLLDGMQTVVIDVNGEKGPNKWGYDVFFMTLALHNGSNKISLSQRFCSLIEKGGRFPNSILQNSDGDT